MKIHARVQEAILRESFLAMGQSSPNPPVAAVLTDPHGEIVLASAHTQPTGQNHAERQAYSGWDNVPHRIYVTLEPCNHFGRTPPCRDLILDRLPTRVICGHRDPHPVVAETSDNSVYERAGIEFEFNQELEVISRPFLVGYISRVARKRPKMIFKVAVTRDGYFAPSNRKPIAISGEGSRGYLQLLRAKVDAILVGPGTVAADCPGLDFRIPESCPSPMERKGFSARNSFWDVLERSAQDERVWSYHRDRFETYQPDRIFVMGRESAEWLDFFTKQEYLQSRYTRSRVFFYFLQKPEDYSSSVLARLDSLVRSHSRFLPAEDWGNWILEDLARSGINTLLVEGGNLAFREFGRYAQPGDECLEIRSGSLLLGEGIRPSGIWTSVGEAKPDWESRWGEDWVRVYEYGSEQ